MINWKKRFTKYMELCVICFFNTDFVLLECCYSEMSISFEEAVKMPPFLESFLILEHL